MNNYTEDKLVEQPAIAIFKSLGYGFVNAFKEQFTGNVNTESISPELGRTEMDEVVLVPRLRDALQKFNADAPQEAIDLAIDELVKDRSLMSPTQANQEVYLLIRDGVNVSVIGEDGDSVDVRVKVIDFDDVNANDFFLVSQFWISGDMYKRRMDLIGFVNGLPLIFVELKAAHKDLKDAFVNNLRDYKETIPQLFWYNSFVILSNGIESKIGTITSEFEHFSEWKKINSEGEKGIVSLETIIRGTCDRTRFLDMMENFILYNNEKGNLIKLLAKNHQYLGVNNAMHSLQKVEENKGRLGVFWHTQGSGKSYSMILFSQKVLRKFRGNYTFLAVTDRLELDGQIYKNFANVGAVTEPENMIHAGSVEHLRQLLTEDHRNVFTIIHKFQLQGSEKEFPILSERSDIIVMTDEAHRSQYDTLALNMRSALPNACFIGFTGTPLIEGEEQETKKTFGDYVSIYDFKQSVEDGATVPLFYENRIPELQLNHEALEENLDYLLDNIDLNTDEEKKLEREFSREYHLITREDRLSKIAQDVIMHFTNRGNGGKAMFVCIDRLTAVKMYEKMKAQPDCPDIAVVISSSQNEVSYFKDKGFDITVHRRRMIDEDLETKFKDSTDSLKIVIVCSMWLTGFDVPGLSTIYLDKPMKNHTLMQTIARANRVNPGKINGLIVDYIGVFRNLQKALAVYAVGSGGDEMPIKSKEKLIDALDANIKECEGFCDGLGFSVETIENAESLEKLHFIEYAVNCIIATEETKNKFLNLSNQVVKLFGAILPDRNANRFFSKVKTLRVVADRVRVLTKKDIDVDEIVDDIENILDAAIEADGYKIRESKKITDLSKIDFEKLRTFFDKGKANIETEKLRQSIEKKLSDMVKLNPVRLQLAEKFQKLIEEYNSGAKNVEEFFNDLMKFAQVLNEEEKRNVKEGLSTEELAIFDLLYKGDLSDKEKTQIKKMAKDILGKLKNKFVIDWRKKQQARAEIKVAIADVIYDELPESYTTTDCQQSMNLIYRHVYDSYWGEDNSVYATKEIVHIK